MSGHDPIDNLFGWNPKALKGVQIKVEGVTLNVVLQGFVVDDDDDGDDDNGDGDYVCDGDDGDHDHKDHRPIIVISHDIVV